VTNAKTGEYLVVLHNENGINLSIDDRFGHAGREWKYHSHQLHYEGHKAQLPVGKILETDVYLTTGLKPGSYPLKLTLENVGEKNVEIALLLNVTSMGSPGIKPQHSVINAPKTLTISAPKTTLHGDLTIDGSLSVAKKLNLTSHRIDFPGGWHFGTRSDKDMGNWFYFRNKSGKSMFYVFEDDDMVRIGTGYGIDKPLKIKATKLGINTATPKTTLEVNGRITSKGLTSTDSVRFEDNWAIKGHNDRLRFSRDKIEKIWFANDGRIHSHGVTTNANIKLGKHWTIGYSDDTQLQFKYDGKFKMILHKNGNLWLTGSLSENLTIT
ncbi:MAG: hypothetical protein AAGD04_13410, partial [Pseudomonadota bacterium]